MAKKTQREHVVYHKDGTIWAKGPMVDGVCRGYWEWFRKDGTKLRSGAFDDKGQQMGAWTTYDRNGDVYKVTMIKPKTAAAKKAMPKKASATTTRRKKVAAKMAGAKTTRLKKAKK
jgi:antitoxin component YwqK of YwqJK toxin-antitoxin module